MARHRKATVWCGGMLVLLGAMALSACGGSSAATKPTATADASSILTNAGKLQFTDLEYTLTLDGTSSGETVSGSFTGVETTSPKRSDTTINLTSGTDTLVGEVIIDGTTNTSYEMLTSPAIPGVPAGDWIKTTGDSNLLPFDPTTFTDLTTLTGATLKGSETIDGVAVWHFQATDSIDGSSDPVDLYIRQDNGQLYEFTATETGDDTGTVTFKVTGENTGKTISLPPDSQVVSQ